MKDKIKHKFSINSEYVSPVLKKYIYKEHFIDFKAEVFPRVSIKKLNTETIDILSFYKPISKF